MRGSRRIGLVVPAVLALSIVSALADAGTWDRVVVPYVTRCPQIVASNGTVFVSGGQNTAEGPGRTASDEIWSFNLTSQQWRQSSGRLPYGLFTSLPGKAVGDLILFGPDLGTSVNNGWPQHKRMIEYNTITEQARETAAFPYNVAGAVPVDVTTVAGQSRVYTFGAWNGSTSYRDIFRYDAAAATLTQLTTAILSAGDAAYCSGTDARGNILIFGEYPNARQRVEKFNPVTETIVSYGDILPADMTAGGFSWTDTAGRMFIANMANNSVFQVDSTAMTFTRQAWSLPAASAGYALNPYVGAYDPVTDQLLLSEHKWTGSAWTSNLIVGIPEPASVSLLALGGLAVLRRRRK